MSWPAGAVTWSLEQIHKDAETARNLFRKRRFGEPMDHDLKAFAALEATNKKVIAQLPDLFIEGCCHI